MSNFWSTAALPTTVYPLVRACITAEQAKTPDINAENPARSTRSLATDRSRSLAIIGYHEITARKDQAVIPDYAVTDKQFELHLSWLQKNGYHFVSVSQIIKAKEGKYKTSDQTCLLTVDDGYQSFYQYAYPIIKKRKIPVVMSVVGSWLETKNNTLVQFGDDQLERKKLLSWDELKTMQNSGYVEIGDHSYNCIRGIMGNPQGNSEPLQLPVNITRTKSYESDKLYWSYIVGFKEK